MRLCSLLSAHSIFLQGPLSRGPFHWPSKEPFRSTANCIVFLLVYLSLSKQLFTLKFPIHGAMSSKMPSSTMMIAAALSSQSPEKRALVYRPTQHPAPTAKKLHAPTDAAICQGYAPAIPAPKEAGMQLSAKVTAKISALPRLSRGPSSLFFGCFFSSFGAF